MHPVLDSQSDGSVAQEYESFKERLGEPSPSSFFVHDDRAKLLVVANEDGLFTA